MIRPILTATIGYLIGIIMGLYLKNIVLFYVLIAVITLILYILKLKIKFLRRYLRYIKLVVNFKVIILILITSLIGYKYTSNLNNKYEETYDKMEKQNTIEAEGIITSNVKEKDYNNEYEIKIENKKFICYLNKKEKIEYGDKVKIKGTYKRPSDQRNFRRI